MPVLCSPHPWVQWLPGILKRLTGTDQVDDQELKDQHPIFPSGCEGKLGVALESLQGLRDLT